MRQPTYLLLAAILTAALSFTGAVLLFLDARTAHSTAHQLDADLALAEADLRAAKSLANHWQAIAEERRGYVEGCEADLSTLQGAVSDLGRCESAVGFCEDARRGNDETMRVLRERVEVLAHQLDLRNWELCEARRAIAGEPPGCPADAFPRQPKETLP